MRILRQAAENYWDRALLQQRPVLQPLSECIKGDNFQKDVQLLTDLQELISDAERTANMPGYAGAVFNAISPALKAAMPAAQKKARRQIDVLTRAKERLMELMEEPQK